MQRGFHHDIRRCMGCRACVMACRSAKGLEPGLKWREVYTYRQEPGRYYLSVACSHCESPECVRVCLAGAFTKRPDGVVLLDPAKCTGCRLCTLACPHGMPRYSPKRRKVSKCDFCADRLATGGEPACVAACPTRALTVIDTATFAEAQALASVPGFPDSPLTTPSVRFTLPEAPPDKEDRL